MTDPEPADGQPAEAGDAQEDAGGVWAFDVDGCLMGGASPRPFARDLLTALRARGIRVVLWSGGGAAWALAGVRPYLAPNPGDQACLEIIDALKRSIPACQEKEKSI